MNVPSADSRRRYRSRDEVQDLVSQFHQPGLSAKGFVARMGGHPMSVRRWIRISSSQASAPDSKARILPVELRQPDVASPHGLSAEIIHPAGPVGTQWCAAGRMGGSTSISPWRDDSADGGWEVERVAHRASRGRVAERGDRPPAGHDASVRLGSGEVGGRRAPEDSDVDDRESVRAAAWKLETRDGLTSPGPGRGSRPAHTASTAKAGNHVLHRRLVVEVATAKAEGP